MSNEFWRSVQPYQLKFRAVVEGTKRVRTTGFGMRLSRRDNRLGRKAECQPLAGVGRSTNSVSFVMYFCAGKFRYVFGSVRARPPKQRRPNEQCLFASFGSQKEVLCFLSAL